MSESSTNTTEENKQCFETESLQQNIQLNICNNTTRQILKKQITYTAENVHASLNNLGLNRFNSFDTKEESSIDSKLMKVNQHDNSLAKNHNLSYESRMSSVNDFLLFIHEIELKI